MTRASTFALCCALALSAGYFVHAQDRADLPGGEAPECDCPPSGYALVPLSKAPGPDTPDSIEEALRALERAQEALDK